MSEDRVGYPVDEGNDETRRCAECGAPLPDDLKRCLGVALRGGYGTFFDDLELDGPLYAVNVMTVWLCHDCAVRLLSSFSGLGNLLCVGEHPSIGHTPCCKWCWVPKPEVGELHERLMDEAAARQWLSSVIDEKGASEGAAKWSAAADAAPITEETLRRALGPICTCDPSMRFVCDVCSCERPTKDYGKP